MLDQSSHKLPVNNKRPLADLYKTFMKSANFGSWLQARTSDLNREWRRNYLNVLCTQDMKRWTQERVMMQCEVECVDLFLRLQEEIVCSF
jgi:hypothetical protein